MIHSPVWIISFQVDISCFVNKIFLVQEVCADLLIKLFFAQEPRVGIVIFEVSKSALLPKISRQAGVVYVNQFEQKSSGMAGIPVNLKVLKLSHHRFPDRLHNFRRMYPAQLTRSQSRDVSSSSHNGFFCQRATCCNLHI